MFWPVLAFVSLEKDEARNLQRFIHTTGISISPADRSLFISKQIFLSMQ